MSERIIITAPGEGVAVGGRFDGWRMRQHPDGQWVSVARLEAVDPFAKAEGVLGMLFAEHRAKSDATPTPAGAGDLVEGLRAHIAALGVACCTCGAKTFQAEFHDANCKVRNVAEALDNVDDIASRIEALEAEVSRLSDLADKYKWQVHDTCKRAEKAEAERDALKAEVERKNKALREAGEAIAEYFRYLHGGETRGSYDGKPEREGLRKAGYAVSRALAPAKAGG